MCKHENDGVMYKFHDVNDLKSLLAQNIPSQGLYVIKSVNNNLSSLQKYFSPNRLMPHHILTLENIIFKWRHLSLISALMIHLIGVIIYPSQNHMIA